MARKIKKYLNKKNNVKSKDSKKTMNVTHKTTTNNHKPRSKKNVRRVKTRKLPITTALILMVICIWMLNINGIFSYFTSTSEITNIFELAACNITFDSNTGTGTMPAQKVYYNIAANLSQNIYTKDNYQFVGWNTQADGSGTSYTDGQSITITGDTTLYAQWNAKTK